MIFELVMTKYGTGGTNLQGQSSFLCCRRIFMTMVVGMGVFWVPQTGWAQESTSPLEILQHAPKVRFDDPEPTPRPVGPVPYVPPRGPAPAVRPVAPAFTPYAGESVGGGAAVQPGYGQQGPARPTVMQQPVVTPRAYIPARPTPTPRPVLGPEDVEKKEKKRGFVRGLINAIPFVGDDDEDEGENQERLAPIAPPGASSGEGMNAAPGQEPPIYRGYETPEPGNAGEPILLPPGSTPIHGVFPGDPEPSSPPIMTPEPRHPAPDTTGEFGPTNTGTAVDGGLIAPPANDAPVLTVKRESDTTSTEPTPINPGEASTDLDTMPTADEKRPAMSRAEEAPTPRPLEKATTGVLIQESRPGSDGLGPVPDSSAAPLKPYDPTSTPAPDESADMATSLTIEQSDLGMPNPTYEQNAAVLAEFQEAVRKARTEDYESAAQLFREYSLNHPSSGLAPRAYFLSIIFEKNRTQARENQAALERLFPESRYVKAVQERRPDLAAATAGVAGTTPVPADTETPAQKVSRLEKDLTIAIGNPEKEPAIRVELALAYLHQEEYARAYEVLRPAVDMASGTPLEAEALLAMGRVLIARGETVQAISLYESVEEKSPTLIYKDAETAWNVGLAFEGAGRYSKARSIYNTIRQRWPATSEAGWASKRLTDLAALRQ